MQGVMGIHMWISSRADVGSTRLWRAGRELTMDTAGYRTRSCPDFRESELLKRKAPGRTVEGKDRFGRACMHPRVQ